MATSPPPIVVGYDRGEASQNALNVAAGLALGLQADLHVVHVVDLSDYPVDPDRPDWEQQAEGALGDERELADMQLHQWPGHWSYEVARGDPVRALCTVADRLDAAMIVVGTHGEGFGVGLQRFLSGGSVSHALVRSHTRPVLVVPLPHQKRRQQPA